MKLLKQILLAVAIGASFASAFGGSPHNWHFQAANADYTGYDDFWFGDDTDSSTGVFVWDPVVGHPVIAHLDTSVVFDSTSGLIGAIGAARSFNNAPSHTIQTVAASANGFQLSTGHDASVTYSITTTTTATIAGASSGYVVLEICPTNSATAGNWTEISRSGNGQTLTLALTLQSVQNVTTPVSGMVPLGYYSRLRSVNVSGTPTYVLNSGQDVLN